MRKGAPVLKVIHGSLAGIAPVETGTLGQRVYSGLRDYLMAGQLHPGQKLTLRELAAALNVSPMPVREAVRRLAAEGALEMLPNRRIRVPVVTKPRFRELLRIIHPRVANPVKLGGQLVENNVVFAVLAYVFVYVSCIIVFTLLLTLTGADEVTALSAAVVSLNNTGPGLAQVGPASNYSVLSDFQIWLCSFGMLLGRLELFTLLVVLTPAFWRK